MTSSLDKRNGAGRRDWWAGVVIAIVLLAMLAAGVLTGHGGEAAANAGILAAVAGGAVGGSRAWRGRCRRR